MGPARTAAKLRIYENHNSSVVVVVVVTITITIIIIIIIIIHIDWMSAARSTAAMSQALNQPTAAAPFRHRRPRARRAGAKGTGMHVGVILKGR